MKRTFTRTFSYFRAYRFQLVLVFIGIALSAMQTLRALTC